MAVQTYREKRQTRRRITRIAGEAFPSQHPAEPARLIALGTLASLVPERTQRPALSVLVAGRYEVHVGSDFQPATLARLVRTLEQLA